MSFKQPPELHELQSDALGESLTGNPHLAASAIPSRNKKLATMKQFVVGAVNELLSTIQSIKTTVDASLRQQQAVIGDFTADKSLLDDLHKIDASALKGLIKIYKDVCGDLDSPKDISAVAPSVKEAILKMNAEISQIKGCQFRDVYVTTGSAPMHDFLLTYKPVAESVELFVNGVRYAHTYDAKTRVVSWAFAAECGGFDLLADYHVEIVYSYLLAENV